MVLLITCLSTTYLKEVCHDSDNGKKDELGFDCTIWYNDFPEDCGKYDNDDFSANSMCCACKGRFSFKFLYKMGSYFDFIKSIISTFEYLFLVRI